MSNNNGSGSVWVWIIAIGIGVVWYFKDCSKEKDKKQEIKQETIQEPKNEKINQSFQSNNINTEYQNKTIDNAVSILNTSFSYDDENRVTVSLTLKNNTNKTTTAIEFFFIWRQGYSHLDPHAPSLKKRVQINLKPNSTNKLDIYIPESGNYDGSPGSMPIWIRFSDGTKLD